MQLTLDIEFELVKPPIKGKVSSFKSECYYCHERTYTYAVIPSDYDGPNPYSDFLSFMCQECYDKKNVDGVLDECLKNYERRMIIKSQKLQRRNHMMNVKFAIGQQWAIYRDSKTDKNSKQTRKVLVEKYKGFVKLDSGLRIYAR